MRKHLALGVVLLAFASSFALQHGTAAPPAPQRKSPTGPVQTFTGVISDGQCAKNGSHEAVMKKASVNSAANCTKGWAGKHGYVLFDQANKKIYKLAEQTRPAEYAAQKVKITGKLEKSTQTIFVTSIEPAN